jgi:enterochelin esterase-like enzyme
VAQVYLPGGYAQNLTQRYPVLYALDGQQLPEIDFQQTLNELVSSGQMAPTIVVAVYSTEGDLRREELGAGPNINFLGWGTSSDAFNRFMVNELVPKVNNSYRTLIGPQNTAVMGWSLGGLASFYLVWQYPDTFGTAGAFSPSFWWRTESPAGQELQARVIPNLVASSPQRPGMRFWLEAGTKELPYSDIDGNGVIDMIQDARDVRDLLLQKGYRANSDVVYVEVEGGLHELSTWQTVIPDFLKFAFPVS